MATSNIPYHARRRAAAAADDPDAFARMRARLMGEAYADGGEGGDGGGEGGDGGGEGDADEFPDTQEFLNSLNGGGDGNDDPDKARVAALQTALETERMSRERLEREVQDRESRVAALSQLQDELNARLQEMSAQVIAKDAHIDMTPPAALVEQIGEQAAIEVTNHYAKQISEFQAKQATTLDARLQNILKKAGLSLDGVDIDTRIAQRLQERDTRSWDDKLHELIPGVDAILSSPQFRTWAAKTVDGLDTVMTNVVTAVKRQSARDLDYCKRAIGLFMKANGEPAIGRQTSATRGGRSGPSTADNRRVESPADRAKRKREARNATSGWTKR